MKGVGKVGGTRIEVGRGGRRIRERKQRSRWVNVGIRETGEGMEYDLQDLAKVQKVKC